MKRFGSCPTCRSTALIKQAELSHHVGMILQYDRVSTCAGARLHGCLLVPE